MSVQTERYASGDIHRLAIQDELFAPPELDARERHRYTLHEAAHAVILLQAGGKVYSVAFDPVEVVGGVRGEPWTASAILAGPAAEIEAGLRTLDRPVPTREEIIGFGWAGDVEAYRRHRGARRFASDLAAARTRVRECWPAIEAVAAALRERGPLTGADVRRIVDSTQPE